MVESQLEDYENFSLAQAIQPSNQPNNDSAETSEDEMELSYAAVNFVAKSGLLVNSRTCDREETDYSDVQFWVSHWCLFKVALVLCCI